MSLKKTPAIKPACFAAIKPTALKIPPSKSHSIRSLILASLASEKSKIKNLLISGDTKTAVKILSDLGVKINIKKNKNKSFTAKIKPPQGGLKKTLIKLYAEKNKLKNKELKINVENSGSLLYFLGVLLAFFPVNFILTGDKSVCKRPLSPLIEIYDKLNIQYDFLDFADQENKNQENKTAPIKVFGKQIEPPENILLDGKFSQPITGLLIASAFALDNFQFNLKEAGELPYLKMTIQWLKKSGIQLTHDNDFKNFKIKGNQKFKKLNCTIPADWSSAAFPLTAAVITNSPLIIKDIDLNDCQGDSKTVEILEKIGVNIFFNSKKKYLTVRSSLERLKGIEIDCCETPDLVPILATLACFCEGKTILKNIEICRFKECDRIAAINTELSKLGADIEEGNDYLIINGQGGRNLHSGEVNSYGDHRIAMSLLCMAFAMKKHNRGIVKVLNSNCYSVSYPEFLFSFKRIERQYN